MNRIKKKIQIELNQSDKLALIFNFNNN